MFLLYFLVVLLMFPAAFVLLAVSVHEGVTLLSTNQKPVRTRSPIIDGIKRATQEITAILGLNDD